MIVEFNKERENCSTAGCGCCEDSLSLKSDKDEILENLEYNIKIVIDVLDYYGIKLNDFIKTKGICKTNNSAPKK